MKISWGTGIALFYSLFVIVLLGFVYASTQQDISLVSDTYYEEDLNYQKKMDKISEMKSLKEDFQLSFIQDASSISILYPKELTHFKGKMTLFHPAYSNLDQTYWIENNLSFNQMVNFDKPTKGRWLVKIEGENEGKSYFHETYLMAP